MKLSARAAGSVILAALAALLHFSQPGAAYASDHLGNVEKLLPERTAICWHDGDRLDDLVLNARGKITFLYMDGRLAGALARLREEQTEKGPVPEIPRQLFAYSRKYNSRKKHVVFVARVDALKMWDFDSEKISVGGYSLSEKDIIKGGSSNPNAELRHGTAELPKNYRGYIGFFVPSENVTPGTKIKLRYGEDAAEWTVPPKN
jgi:hypothetical protein